MAEKPLLDVAASTTVSAAAVEKFKMEWVAEREFLSKLSVLVSELSHKVSPRNPVYASMARFLKARI